MDEFWRWMLALATFYCVFVGIYAPAFLIESGWKNRAVGRVAGGVVLLFLWMLGLLAFSVREDAAQKDTKKSETTQTSEVTNG